MNKWENLAAKIGLEKAKERALNYACSLTLGRDFNETLGSFLLRRPEVAKQVNEAKEYVDKIAS